MFNPPAQTVTPSGGSGFTFNPPAQGLPAHGFGGGSGTSSLFNPFLQPSQYPPTSTSASTTTAPSTHATSSTSTTTTTVSKKRKANDPPTTPFKAPKFVFVSMTPSRSVSRPSSGPTATWTRSRPRRSRVRHGSTVVQLDAASLGPLTGPDMLNFGAAVSPNFNPLQTLTDNAYRSSSAGKTADQKKAAAPQGSARCTTRSRARPSSTSTSPPWRTCDTSRTSLKTSPRLGASSPLRGSCGSLSRITRSSTRSRRGEALTRSGSVGTLTATSPNT